MELGKLNQLRRLGIVKLRKKDGKALCYSIENLGNLHALSVTSIEENEIIDMQSLSSPPPTSSTAFTRQTPREVAEVDIFSPFLGQVSPEVDSGYKMIRSVSIQSICPIWYILNLYKFMMGRDCISSVEGFVRLRILGSKQVKQGSNQ
ncbi:hypothetical protein OIU85_029774 [Salix viminalis]|uniref:Uncharacterized protein n=1 Tax=Salix viminalis TaxID=40686 RepID=A0A9Q0T7J1_SALVM|nr:hypothetical protein OIU85_029774 [Salix viminalis]